MRLWIAKLLGRALIFAGRPRGRRRRTGPPAGEQSLDVFTFVNDERHYTQMRASFAAAGFNVGFHRLGDRTDDPYAAITRIGQGSMYSILCHQDVRIDRANVQDLWAAIRNLNELDPYWVVAGVAGVTANMRVIRRLVDHRGGSTGDRLPAKVAALDEVFLLFNRGARCSPDLRGFHLYGTDVCLNALADGRSCYVIDFPLTHVRSRHHGKPRPDEYHRLREEFVRAWNPRCLFRYVGTPIEVVFLSRHPLLQKVFGSQRAIDCVSLHRRTHTDDYRMSGGRRRHGSTEHLHLMRGSD